MPNQTAPPQGGPRPNFNFTGRVAGMAGGIPGMILTNRGQIPSTPVPFLNNAIRPINGALTSFYNSTGINRLFDGIERGEGAVNGFLNRAAQRVNSTIGGWFNSAPRPQGANGYISAQSPGEWAPTVTNGNYDPAAFGGYDPYGYYGDETNSGPPDQGRGPLRDTPAPSRRLSGGSRQQGWGTTSGQANNRPSGGVSALLRGDLVNSGLGGLADSGVWRQGGGGYYTPRTQPR